MKTKSKSKSAKSREASFRLIYDTALSGKPLPEDPNQLTQQYPVPPPGDWN